MMQTELFDWQTWFEQLDNGDDPLVKLNTVVDWELFRKDLEAVRDKERKSNAGRCRHKKLTEREKQGNHTRSKTRCRVEHIFGVQAQRAGGLIVRSIGLVRAKAKIGLRNLAYNIDRYQLLATR